MRLMNMPRGCDAGCLAPLAGRPRPVSRRDGLAQFWGGLGGLG